MAAVSITSNGNNVRGAEGVNDLAPGHAPIWRNQGSFQQTTWLPVQLNSFKSRSLPRSSFDYKAALNCGNCMSKTTTGFFIGKRLCSR